MANLNNWASRFRKGLASATPFSSFGMLWCVRCRSEQEHDTDSRHVGKTFAFKQWCRRCGHVNKYGVFDNVPLLSRPLPAAALTWVTTPAQDRR